MAGQTGPKTDEGKDVAKLNAVKHGLRSPGPVIHGIESEAEWRRHRQGILDSLEPVGHLETVLAEREAELLWRLHRLRRYETEMTEVHLNAIPDDMALAANYGERALGIPVNETITPESVKRNVSRRLLPDAETLNKIMRYEGHIHRVWLQTHHELEAIQFRRKGGHSPLARLDISGPPGA